MKRRIDKSLWFAIIVLIGLVVYLIVLSLNSRNDAALQQSSINYLQKQIELLKQPSIKPQIKSIPGPQGVQGKSGLNGTNGKDGKNGKDGIDGLNAYLIALQNGFVGTEKEWLNSLKGQDGYDGRSLILKCLDGTLKTKYDGDFVWTNTKIVCEVTQ